MILRLLIDECVQAPISRALAAAGHDLRYVGIDAVSALDPDVAALAQADGRILVTEDYDFGELAIRRGVKVPGVILMYLGGMPPADRPAHVLTVLVEVASELEGYLTILEPRRVRRRPLG